MENIVLIPVDQLIEQIRQTVKKELEVALKEQQADKLLSSEEACKVFQPNISRQTLGSWSKNGLLSTQRVGGKNFYRYSDLIEAGTRLKKYKRF